MRIVPWFCTLPRLAGRRGQGPGCLSFSPLCCASLRLATAFVACTHPKKVPRYTIHTQFACPGRSSCQDRMASRHVPWSGWEEWREVGRLLSGLQQQEATCADHQQQRVGLARVEAWRHRGRVPLAVDVTAALVQAQLTEQGILADGAPGTGGMIQPSPDYTLRLLYALPLLRLVNGVADAQQKGKVAASVAVLATAAGLPKLAVDVRHAATHGELPTLALLKVCASQVLAWLRSTYWEAQSAQLTATCTRIRGLLFELRPSPFFSAPGSKAGVKRGRQEEEEEEGDDDDDEENYQDVQEEEEGVQGSAAAATPGLDAIPGEAAFPRLPKKDRWAPAAKLRVLVPAPWCEALVQPCLELMTPPASGTGLEECLLTAPGAVQTPAAMPGSQQTSASQQQQQATQNPGKRAKVWQKRMGELYASYPALRLLLLRACITRLAELACGAQPALPAAHAAWGDAERDATLSSGAGMSGTEQAAQGAQELQRLARWLIHLTPLEYSTHSPPPTLTPAGKGGKQGGAGKQRQQQPSKMAQQMGSSGASLQAGGQPPAAPGAVEPGGTWAIPASSTHSKRPGVFAPLGLEQVTQLLRMALKGLHPSSCSTGAVSTAARTVLRHLTTALQDRLKGTVGDGAAHSDHHRQHEQQSIEAERARKLARLTQLTSPGSAAPKVTATPAGPSSAHKGPQENQADGQAALEPGTTASSLAEAKAGQAALLQQLQNRAQGLSCYGTSNGTPAGEPANPEGGLKPKPRWSRVESWAPCAIGCLPDALSPSGYVPVLAGTQLSVVRVNAGDAPQVPRALPVLVEQQPAPQVLDGGDDPVTAENHQPGVEEEPVCYEDEVEEQPDPSTAAEEEAVAEYEQLEGARCCVGSMWLTHEDLMQVAATVQPLV